MTTLRRALDRWTSGDTDGKHVSFARREPLDTDALEPVVLSWADWDDLGRPDEITITIQSGNRIEPPTDAEVEAACEVMHDAYEAAAVGAGWETQEASRKPWADVPEANKVTMRAAVHALLIWTGR